MFKWFWTIFSLGAPDIPSRTTSGVQPRIENYKDERLKVIQLQPVPEGIWRPDHYQFKKVGQRKDNSLSLLFRGTQRGYSSKPLNIALLNVF